MGDKDELEDNLDKLIELDLVATHAHLVSRVRGGPPQSLGSRPLIVFDNRGGPGAPGAFLEHYLSIPGRFAARSAARML